MELARLSQERKRLTEERAHWERRIQHIHNRLLEIAEADEWLRRFLQQAEYSTQGESAQDVPPVTKPRARRAAASPRDPELVFRY